MATLETTASRLVRVKVFEGTVSAIESAINTWLAGSAERRILDIRHSVSGSTHAALIAYTD